MKILLIKPPPSRKSFVISLAEPLELEYLGASVRHHEVEILDMRIDKNLNKKLEAFRPHFVGITTYTCNANMSIEVLREVKKFSNKIKTGVGGYHASFLPSYFRKPFVDIVFLGMADFTFPDYIDTLERGDDPDALKNIALVKETGLHFTRRGDVGIDLDALPSPSRNLTRHYRKHYRDHLRRRTAYVLTSRGCPYRCTFCACWKMMDGNYYTRSPESIVEEIGSLEGDIDRVCFADDNTLYDTDRAWNLCRLLKEKDIDKKYSMYGRADTIVKNPDLIESFKNVGLENITVGVESISNIGLRQLRKGLSVRKNEEAIRILQRLGITIGAHFIITPDFSVDDFKDLYRYICRMELFQPVFATLTPLPGTELFHQTHEQILFDNFDYFDFIHSVLPTKLPRKHFYKQLSSLYLKTYSFKRFFFSYWSDLKNRIVMRKKYTKTIIGRPSLLGMIAVHIIGYPLALRLRYTYKTEQ